MDANTPGENVKDTPKTTPINNDLPGMMAKPEAPGSDQAWKEWVDLIFGFLAQVPDQVGGFFSNYKQPLVTLLLFATGAVTVYVTLAVLQALNDIPLVSPVLELVGLGYSGWFVYRYLLRAGTRSELLGELNTLKNQVLGKGQAK